MKIDEISLFAGVGFLLWSLGLFPLRRERIPAAVLWFTAFSSALTFYCGICHDNCVDYPISYLVATTVWVGLMWRAVHVAGYRMFSHHLLLWASPLIAIAVCIAGSQMLHRWTTYRVMFYDLRSCLTLSLAAIAAAIIALRDHSILGRRLPFRNFLYWIPFACLVMIEGLASVIYLLSGSVSEVTRTLYAFYALLAGMFTLAEAIRRRKASGDDVTPLAY
jgi:hypothetical protein